VAVLAVVGVFALPNLLGGGGDTSQGNPSNEQVVAGSSNREGGNENQGSRGDGSQGSQGGDRGPQDEQANIGNTSGGNAGNEDQGSQDSSNNEPDGELTAEDAEQTVREHYEVAASDDYQDAWNYLSSSYQQQVGSPGAWTNQFRTLESVRFTSGPAAEVSGNTATVSFSTVAQHTDRTDTPSLTATLVKEDGEWKIDSL